jgi:phage head maturation protease
VSEDAYDRDTHTRTIQRIGRLFDVSAVDIPAYDGTDITARSYFEAEAEKVNLEKLERKKKLLKLKLQLGGN